MSSSPSRAPEAAAPAETEGAPHSGLAPHGEAANFSYGEAVFLPGQHNFTMAAAPVKERESPKPAAAPVDNSRREAQCREEGRLQGAAESRARFDEQLAQEREGLGKALADFSRERAAYYANLEEEAVRLALSIARKILHREARVDPLLLQGIAHVALGKIAGASAVALLVNPQRAAEWRKFLAARMDPGSLPEVIEDPLLTAEQCVLRTSMGSADLSLEVQLKEIENGLMDLLAARPREQK